MVVAVEDRERLSAAQRQVADEYAPNRSIR